MMTHEEHITERNLWNFFIKEFTNHLSFRSDSFACNSFVKMSKYIDESLVVVNRLAWHLFIT